jgi:cell division protein FtsN
MPKLNLRDDGFEEDSNPLDADQPVAPPPTLREVGGGGGGGEKTSTLLTVLLIVVVLAGGVFALNYFKVIHLWGKRVPKIDTQQFTDQLPLPETNQEGTGATDSGAVNTGAEQTTPLPQATLGPPAARGPMNPAASARQPSAVQSPPIRSTRPTESTPAFAPPPSSGTGTYTVQVSSWTSKGMAEKEVSRLTAAGMDAFVEDAVIAGENWYRVRIGRYATSREAREAANQLAKSLEGNIWVARTSTR